MSSWRAHQELIERELDIERAHQERESSSRSHQELFERERVSSSRERENSSRERDIERELIWSSERAHQELRERESSSRDHQELIEIFESSARAQ